MIDTKFLNEKATKFKTALKKIKSILDRGEEEFLKTPMYPDRVKYYAIIAYDELEEIACHLLKNILREKHKENCLEKLVDEQIFPAKTSRIFSDFINFRKTIMEENFSYSEKELYSLLKSIVEYLNQNFIPELAKIVNELKKKEPKLSIPVNVTKVNEQAQAIKSTLKKIEVFLKNPKEDFLNSPYAIDRTKYFTVVALDSALWICRHVSRAAKLPRSKECFLNLAENGIISKETGEKLQNLANLREKLVNPTEEIDLDKFYDEIKGTLPYFLTFIREVASAIVGKKNSSNQKS